MPFLASDLIWNDSDMAIEVQKVVTINLVQNMVT